MAKYVEAAELMRYNANSSGRSTGDCVKRSISLAFDAPYSQVAKLLNDKMHELGYPAWNIQQVFGKVITDLGGGKYHKFDDELVLVDEFADHYADPNYIYLVLCGSKPGKTSHMVCIRDNKVWDSWDSRDQFVTGYYVVDGSNAKQVTDIQSKLTDIAENYMQKVVRDQTRAYIDKRNWKCSMIQVESRIADYTLKTETNLTLSPTDWIDKRRFYSFQIAIPIEPTMTEEEAIKHVTKMAKIRTYDRMYAIQEQEKKLEESEKVAKAAPESSSRYEDTHYVGPRERKFLNSLPGWVQPLITYLFIDQPGQYQDSYSLRIHPLPSDPRRGYNDKITFEGYQAKDIKQALDHYKETFEVPWDDYEPWW